MLIVRNFFFCVSYFHAECKTCQNRIYIYIHIYTTKITLISVFLTLKDGAQTALFKDPVRTAQ
jgi:hypothetical protein